MTEPVIINHLVRARSYDDKGKNSTTYYNQPLCFVFMCAHNIDVGIVGGLNMKVLM